MSDSLRVQVGSREELECSRASVREPNSMLERSNLMTQAQEDRANLSSVNATSASTPRSRHTTPTTSSAPRLPYRSQGLSPASGRGRGRGLNLVCRRLCSSEDYLVGSLAHGEGGGRVPVEGGLRSLRLQPRLVQENNDSGGAQNIAPLAEGEADCEDLGLAPGGGDAPKK